MISCVVNLSVPWRQPGAAGLGADGFRTALAAVVDGNAGGRASHNRRVVASFGLGEGSRECRGTCAQIFGTAPMTGCRGRWTSFGAASGPWEGVVPRSAAGGRIGGRTNGGQGRLAV
jgi:hypothetical protein